MAIFKKDLENINEFNDRNRKIHTRSELLQFINLQNEASDYDFVDFKFELDINFKKRFDQHKTIFRNIANNRINQGDGLGVFLNLFNNGIFNKSLTDNLYIFSNLERLVYEVKEEDNLFKNDLTPISNSIKNSKKNRFDFIHSFLLNAFPNNITDNTVLTGPNSALSTVSKNLEYINASVPVFTISGRNLQERNLQGLYKKIVDNPVEFLQVYTGLNFLKTDDFKLIKNHNKPLSLMTLATSINNIIENSFDYASCNSLFKGIYTEDELNSRLKVVDFTSVPFIETDVVKELLPIKYVDKFETINSTELKQLIKDFNTGINSNQNIRKVNNELISEDIFKFENFLCSEEDIQSQINFTIKTNTQDANNINFPSPTNKLFEIITGEEINDLVSIRNKTKQNHLQCINLIANHVNSNQIKLMYGVVNKINNQPDYTNIKYRPVIDTNKKGILNYKFEDVNDFTCSIIKTRLICNNIVKSYKKYSINKGHDASSINTENKMNYFLSTINNVRENIEFTNNALTLNESIIRSNSNNTSLSNIIDSFNNQSHVFEIFKKTKNRINQNLIIINNSILGEMQADDFISSNPELNGVINLNRQINLDGINLDTITQSMNIKKNEIQTIINEYYNESDSVFINTSTFFQKVKKICSDNFKWHLNPKPNTSISSDRADILNNASILWLFNDSCKEMTKEQKETFQDEFINLLISYLYISKKENLNNLKNSYNVMAENIILNKGPTPSTITELAPFFSFFTTDMQNATNSRINSKNMAVRRQSDSSKRYNEYYNITPNTFETNGKSTHFLSTSAKLLEKGSNVSDNSGHKLFDTQPLYYIPSIGTTNQYKKKNILLTGLNFYHEYNGQNNAVTESIEYIFVPQLTFKKISQGNNRYKFEYFIYNAAMAEDPINLDNTTTYDLIQNLIDKFSGSNSTRILNQTDLIKLLDQISYNFSTQNSFLNVLNFGNSYNTTIENDALENNIFYKIINLFKSLVMSLNLTQTNFLAQINDLNNKKIVDLKLMIKNTLKIVSSIYCKMFNNLQSYTNLADRISESNFFYENSPDNQKLLKNISTGAENDTDLRKYSKDMWQYYSNIFLNESHIYTNFNTNDFRKYRSFASKKFLYFLNEVLGIEKNEIEIIMEKILSFNLNSENRNRIFSQVTNGATLQENFNLSTRHSRLSEFIASSSMGSANVDNFHGLYQQITTFLTRQNVSLVEFMTNPFELFNLYNSSLFQLIPGLYNPKFLDYVRTEINQNYQIELTPHLTIMNLFKAGNDLKISYIEKQRNNILSNRNRPNLSFTEKEISKEEFTNLTDALSCIGLFTGGTSFSSLNNPQNNKIQLNNIPFGHIDERYREINSNLIRPASVFTDSNSENFGKLGIEFDNFFDDANIFINFKDYATVNYEKTDLVLNDKENYVISSNLNSFNVFDSIIDNSFNLSTNYDTLIVNNSNSSVKNRLSGLKESYSYSQNFIDLNKVIHVPQISLDLRANNQNMLNQKYVDVNLNWYNHVLHGLITNDLGLAFSYDLLLYYYGNFVTDFKTNYQKLIDKRNTKITIRNQAMNISDVKTNLGKFTGIDRNLFELSTDNVKLQKNYIKSLIKAKSLENIINFKNAVEILTAGLEKFMEKIVSLDNQNENGDFFMSYFDDFYIKDLWHTLNTTTETNFRNTINKNYQRTADNNNSWNIPNQAENILGSHILTVGINNDYKLDKDDIVLIKVEMTDHDFPEIIWEPKVFEYCAAFEDIENVFLQHRAALKIQSINDITNQNPPIGINSSYLEFIKESQSTDALTLKDSLIRNTTGVQNGGLNLNNNIGSINYTGDKSYLNPILYQNKFDEILNVLNLSNDDFIYSKLPYDFISNASQDSIKQVRDEIIKRCIHNQQMNLRLKKISKLLNGFEPNTEFSLSQNKWMQDMFVSSDIYDIFIEKFQKDSNLDNIKELYPFTYEEIKNAVKLNEYSYLELKFHKLHFTTNHKLNVYLQFMSDFTKALLPDFINLTPHNFQKIYTLAVNPKDFIVTGLTGENNIFIPTSSELEFEQILYRPSILGAVNNKILDELGTETSLILRLISNKTIERDNINYYSVKNKKTNQKYIPKNVSYRISTIIME